VDRELSILSGSGRRVVGHFLLLAACIAATVNLPPEKGKWRRFIAGGAAVLVYFGLIIAVAGPR